jgi:hypothetical protein
MRGDRRLTNDVFESGPLFPMDKIPGFECLIARCSSVSRTIRVVEEAYIQRSYRGMGRRGQTCLQSRPR